MNTKKNRIRQLRKILKLSQEQLGQKLGVGKTTISNWETGYSSPDNDSLIKMSEIFETSIDYLLGSAETYDNIPLKYKKSVDETLLKYYKNLVLLDESNNKVIINNDNWNNLTENEKKTFVTMLFSNIKIDENGVLNLQPTLSSTKNIIQPNINNLIHKYDKLNTIGKNKVNEFIDDLLTIEKYTIENLLSSKKY